jgi:hypothetical protein
MLTILESMVRESEGKLDKNLAKQLKTHRPSNDDI